METYNKIVIITVISVLLALSLSLCSISHAETGDTWINLHLKSWHLDDYWREDVFYTVENGENSFTKATYIPHTIQHKHNESNLGLGLTHEWIDHLDIRAGAFKNSFDHTSIYTGIGWHTSYDKTFSATLQVGIASGYKDTPTGGDSLLIGYIIPTIGIGIDKYRAEIGYIPAMGESKSGVFTLSIMIKL